MILPLSLDKYGLLPNMVLVHVVVWEGFIGGIKSAHPMHYQEKPLPARESEYKHLPNERHFSEKRLSHLKVITAASLQFGSPNPSRQQPVNSQLSFDYFQIIHSSDYCL